MSQLLLPKSREFLNAVALRKNLNLLCLLSIGFAVQACSLKDTLESLECNEDELRFWDESNPDCQKDEASEKICCKTLSVKTCGVENHNIVNCTEQYKNYNPSALECTKIKKDSNDNIGVPTCEVLDAFANSPDRCIKGYHPDGITIRPEGEACVEDDTTSCGGQSCMDVFPGYSETALSCDGGTCKKASSLTGLDNPCLTGYHVSTDETACEKDEIANSLDNCGGVDCSDQMPGYTEAAMKCENGTCMKKYDKLDIVDKPCQMGYRLSESKSECLFNDTVEHCGGYLSTKTSLSSHDYKDFDFNCMDENIFKDPHKFSQNSIDCYYGRCVSTKCATAKSHSDEGMWQRSSTTYCDGNDTKFYYGFITYFSGKEIIDLELKNSLEPGSTQDHYVCTDPKDTKFCGNDSSTAKICSNVMPCIKSAPKKDSCKADSLNAYTGSADVCTISYGCGTPEEETCASQHENPQM